MFLPSQVHHVRTICRRVLGKLSTQVPCAGHINKNSCCCCCCYDLVQKIPGDRGLGSSRFGDRFVFVPFPNYRFLVGMHCDVWDAARKWLATCLEIPVAHLLLGGGWRGEREICLVVVSSAPWHVCRRMYLSYNTAIKYASRALKLLRDPCVANKSRKLGCLNTRAAGFFFFLELAP